MEQRQQLAKVDTCRVAPMQGLGGAHHEAGSY